MKKIPLDNWPEFDFKAMGDEWELYLKRSGGTKIVDGVRVPIVHDDKSVWRKTKDSDCKNAKKE